MKKAIIIVYLCIISSLILTGCMMPRTAETDVVFSAADTEKTDPGRFSDTGKYQIPDVSLHLPFVFDMSTGEYFSIGTSGMIVRIDCSDNYVAYIISSSGKDAVILYDISENKRSEIYTAMKIDTTFLTCTGKYVFIGLTYGSIVETKKVLKYDIENDVLSTVFSVDVNDGCAFYAYDEYSGEYMYKYDGDFYLTSNGEYNHMTKINLPEKNKYEYWPDFGYFSRAYPNVLYDHTIDSIVPIPTDKPFYSVKSNGRYCHITRPEDDVMTRNKEYESKSGEKGEYFTCEIYLQNSDGEYSAYELSSDYIGYPLAVYENKILMGVILEYRGSNSVVDVYDRYVWIDLDNGNAVSFKIDNNRWRGPVSEKIDIKLSEIAK